MDDRRHLPFGCKTMALSATDFRKPVNATPNYKLLPPTKIGLGAGVVYGEQGQGNSIFTCPVGARAHLRGNVLGPSGAIGFLSTMAQAFATISEGSPHGMFPDAIAIACGERFHLVLNTGQSLYGLASGGPNLTWGQPDGTVYVSFNWEFCWYEGMGDHQNGGYDMDRGRQ